MSLLKSETAYNVPLNFVPKRLVLYALLISLLIYGFAALHMDFQKYDFKVPDSFYMLSAKFWIFIGFSNALLAIFYVKLREEFFKAIVIIAAYVFIIFPFAQWPVVMGNDQFLHASTAKLIENGLVASDTAEVQDVYLDYPAASIMQLLFKNVTGIDYIFGATILAAFIKGFSILMIYLICSKVFDKRIAALAVVLFLVANFRFNEYYQFAPQALAFSLFLFLIYAYMKSGYDRRFGILVIVTFLLLVVTHPYASFFALMTLASLFGIRKMSKTMRFPHVSGTLLLLALSFWIFWQIYPALGSFNARSSSALDLLTDFGRLEGMFEEVRTIGRSAFNPILLSYQLAVQIFLAAGSIIAVVLTRKHVPRIFIGLLGGLLILTVQLVYTSDPPRVITLDKAVYFGILPATCLTIYLLAHIFRRFSIVHLVIGSTLIALVPLSFLASNQYTYMNSVKSWELDSVIFAVNHVDNYNSKTAIMDSITSKLYTYYSYDSGVLEPFIKGYYIHRNVDDPENLKNITADLALMSFRQEVDWYYHQGTPLEKWDELERDSYVLNADYNRLYDNRYVRLYIKN